MIKFIGTLVTRSLNYNQYSAIADLHNLQFTVTHVLGFSVFTSRLLVTELSLRRQTSRGYLLPTTELLCAVAFPFSLLNKLQE
jgi:hypothetical protein